MPGPEPLGKDLIEFIESLKSRNVEFLVAGAHALAYHGRPRFTEDLDFFVRRTDENVERLQPALRDFGLPLAEPALARLRDDLRGFIALGRKPNRVDRLNVLDVVEFEEAWRRRSPGRLAGVEADFLSLEDYVATKRAKDRLLEFLRDSLSSLPGERQFCSLDYETLEDALHGVWPAALFRSMLPV